MKKKIPFCLLGIFSIFCLVALTSCKNEKGPDTPPNPVEKTEFAVVFETNGGSSVEKQTIEQGNKVAKPADPIKSECTFAGWYKDANCTVEFDFNVEIINSATTIYAKWTSNEKKVKSIEITTNPTKLIYIEGEVFNPEGMVVEVTFEDDTKKTVTDYEYMANFEMSLGLELFPISYGDKEAYVNIEVVEKEITAVEVETNPTKTEYLSYETFDPTGLVLKVSYNNGKYDLITEGYTYSRDYLTSAPKEVVVCYEDKEVTVAISVTKIAAYGVPAQTEPTYVDARAIWQQLEYTESAGNILSSTTFGDIEIVSSSSRYFQYEKVNTGIPSNEYVYWGYKFEGLLKFGGASSHLGRYIVITPTEDGRFYFQSSSTAGASLCIYDEYTEMSTEEDIKQIISLTNQVTEYSFPVYKGETYVLTASANAFIRAMALIYNPTFYEVKEFNINTDNVTKRFAVGQEFNFEGLIASVKLSNDAVYELKEAEFAVEIPDMTTAGTKTIQVSYEGMLVKTYEIEVEAITGIEITNPPAKLEYLVGEQLDLTGMIVSAYTSGGINYQISDYRVSVTEALKIDDIVKISWKGLECALEIEILENPIVSISVKTAPTKTTYKNGEEFDSTGLVLSINYADRTEDMDGLEGVTYNRGIILKDDTCVIASWNIFEVEIPITVTVVDYYDADNTTYLDAITILNAAEITPAASGNININVSVGEVYFNSQTKAFQYEKSSNTYTHDEHIYTGIFKAGGATDSAGRYMRIMPTKNGTLTLYCTATAAQKIYLVSELVAPTDTDDTTYLQKYELVGDSVYVKVEFTLEANQTYYLWFTGQTLIQGMNLSYGKVHAEVESMVLNTDDVKKNYTVGEEFSTEGLVVRLNCTDDNTYTLIPTDYEVEAPDMTTAGAKTVTIKYGDTIVQTFEIEVVNA